MRKMAPAHKWIGHSPVGLQEVKRSWEIEWELSEAIKGYEFSSLLATFGNKKILVTFDFEGD